jgi:hypothetical protein
MKGQYIIYTLTFLWREIGKSDAKFQIYQDGEIWQIKNIERSNRMVSEKCKKVIQDWSSFDKMVKGYFES